MILERTKSKASKAKPVQEIIENIRQYHSKTSPQKPQDASRIVDTVDGWDVRADGTVQRSRELLKANRQNALIRNLKASGVGKRYWESSIDKLELTPGLELVVKGLKNFDALLDSGQNVLLCGMPGSGKTQAAVLIIKHAFEAKKTAKMINLGHIAMGIRAGYSNTSGSKMNEQEAVTSMVSPDVLVIDDLGAGEGAAVERRVLQVALNIRCNEMKMTVVTSNQTAVELTEMYGLRIMNRLEPCSVIPFENQNFRLDKNKKGSVSW